MDDIRFAANFPFTSTAKKILEQSGTIPNDRIIEIALDRIKQSVEGKIKHVELMHDSERQEHIASHAAARMILGCSKNRFLINKYAVAESKRANALLQSSDDETLERVALEFGIITKEEAGKMFIPLPVYLKNAPKSVDYKLINHEVQDGYVIIRAGNDLSSQQQKIRLREKKIRFIEEAIRKHIEKIPLVKNPPPEIENAAEKAITFLPKIEIVSSNISLDIGENPPCIEKILDSLKKHENLPHQARWYLAVYLLNKGMDIEKLVSMYSNLPDYNEKITRYQLEHAKGKRYAVPSCASVLSYGLCCADCKIGNPLNWQKSHLYKRGSK